MEELNMLEVGNKIQHPDWKSPHTVLLVRGRQVVIENRSGWIGLFSFEIEDDGITLDGGTHFWHGCFIVE
jgi:hypothetical protein